MPVFAVFSNAQLAAMAQQRCRTAADLGAIDGVGEARVERYGDAMLAILNAAPPREAGSG